MFNLKLKDGYQKGKKKKTANIQLSQVQTIRNYMDNKENSWSHTDLLNHTCTYWYLAKSLYQKQYIFYRIKYKAFKIT